MQYKQFEKKKKNISRPQQMWWRFLSASFLLLILFLSPCNCKHCLVLPAVGSTG